MCVTAFARSLSAAAELNNRSQNKTSPRHAQKPFQKGGYQIRQVPYQTESALSAERRNKKQPALDLSFTGVIVILELSLKSFGD
jgi:hypothetical protein